jgi:hypothetical protein
VHLKTESWNLFSMQRVDRATLASQKHAKNGETYLLLCQRPLTRFGQSQVAHQTMIKQEKISVKCINRF